MQQLLQQYPPDLMHQLRQTSYAALQVQHFRESPSEFRSRSACYKDHSSVI